MLKDGPLISVIMSCYNEEINWLIESIDSILNQTYNNIEFIIICDNPENDELKQLLLKYKEKDQRIELIFNTINLGLVKSLNIGLRASKGEYIARMDADDISHTDRFEKQLKYFFGHPDTDFVMSGINYIDEFGKQKKCSKILKYKNIKKLLTYGNISVHPTWMFKRIVLDKVHEYQEVLYVEDYDFLCRIILEGYEVAFIKDYLLDYRVRKNGITQSKRTQQEIIYQVVTDKYKNAINKNQKYDIMLALREISSKKIEEFIRFNQEFQIGKKLFKEKRYTEGIFKMLNVLIRSNIKRNQIINYYRLKFMSYLY